MSLHGRTLEESLGGRPAGGQKKCWRKAEGLGEPVGEDLQVRALPARQHRKSRPPTQDGARLSKRRWRMRASP